MSDVAAARNEGLRLAAGPARDSRFTVVERWVECTNFPHDHPLREIEFLHRQMNEEVDSLESCAINISEFPGEEWELRMGLARQCADEARHARMFRSLFESRGGKVGQFPILNIQYPILASIGSVIARLAVQNRCFEAGGLDAIRFGIEAAQKDGDHELAALYEAQHADEIVHVRFANHWVRSASQKDPRVVLQIGAALNLASKAYAYVIGAEGSAGTSYPADVAGRRESGFTDTEVRLAIDLQQNPR